MTLYSTLLLDTQWQHSMILDHLVVCDSNIPWHHNRYSKHHMMSRLARCNDVVFVNPQVDALQFARSHGCCGLSLGARLEQPPGEDLTVFTSLSLPERGRFSALRRSDEAYLVRQLRSVVSRHSGRPLVLFIGNPYNVFLLDAFPEAVCTLYHCSDNFPALFSGGLRAEVERREAELVKRADLVVCSHPDLFTKCRQLGGNAVLLPHGVDESFLGAGTSGCASPPDLIGIDQPIIGLVGSMDAGVDFGLLGAAAESHPEKSFVLIGPVASACHEEAHALGRLTNCHLLGPKPWEELPRYLSHFTVAMVPFVVDEFNLGRSPLKLIEYLAAGLPVVSTALRLDDQLRDYVFVATDVKEFSALIDDALKVAADEGARAKQVALIREQYTWGRRAEELSEMIEAAMRSKAEVTSPPDRVP